MIKLPLVERLRFFIERQFVKGAGFQLLVVAAVIGLISVTGGALVMLSEGSGSLDESVWWAFLRLTDPGYLGDDEGTWRRIVSTFLTVSGYVVFLGALVAIMTQWLIARMREFERGLTPVSLHHHVVILGWTNRTLPLLQELVGSGTQKRRFLKAFDTRRLRAVVLSEDVSPVHAQAIRSDPRLKGEAHNIILRYGSALQEGALARAACLNAAAVIVPGVFGGGNELASPDVETIKTLLSIDARAREEDREPPFAVAEILDRRRLQVINRAYRGPLEVVASDATISRLVAQNLLHPGLSAVYQELLVSREGNEFFLPDATPWQGHALETVATTYPRAIVCGVLRKDGTNGYRPLLNAPSGEPVRSGDRLVLLARQVSDTLPVRRGSQQRSPVFRRARRHPGAPAWYTGSHRLLVLGWNHRIPALIGELASYRPAGFRVELVSVVPAAERERDIRRYAGSPDNVDVHHLEADYMLAGELDRLQLGGFSAVLVVTTDRLDSGEEADARAVVACRMLDMMLAGAPHRPQVLLELADASNAGLVNDERIETLVSPLVISRLLAQVALRRELRTVYDELFTVGGAEITARSPAEFNLAGAVTFAEVEAAAGAHGETALGYLPGDSRQVVLNPPREEARELVADDRLIVMTTTGPER